MAIAGAAALLTLTLGFTVSAVTPRYSMGGTPIVLQAATIGQGYLWNDAANNRLYGSTESSSYKNVGVQLSADVNVYPLDGTIMGNYVSDTDGYVESSLNVEGVTTNDYCYADHDVNGVGVTTKHLWNAG